MTDRAGVESPPAPSPTLESLTGGVGLQDLLQIAGFAPKPAPPLFTLPKGATPLVLTPTEREANLDKNLRSMPAQAVRTIRKIAAAAPREDVSFYKTEEGSISAVLAEDGQPARQLASLRRPREEAQSLTKDIDPAASGAVAVLGFALGYHVEALARRYGKMGVLLAFEPDVGLLRAVLEHVDHSKWLELRNCVIVTDPDDQGEITASITGAEGIFMLGTRYLDHPPSKGRLGDAAERFSNTLSGALRAVRTSIVTTLVQVDKTIRNQLGNLESYANAPGIAELAGAAHGKPAIVVSAGPSLRRNVDLLKDPAVRSRFVVIAVQTVLKTLLAKGIKPDFVTALDHDSISKRFYEGLTASDVEGVTLVVEAKASPAIFSAFPGSIRCSAEKVLDGILSDGMEGPMRELLHRERGELKPGATVAHLAYYLARHLGCDPVILIGQDLGFTDGQYYAAGAAIHQVWSSELNEFNTLEMLEWQRIVRQRSMLHKRKDHLGRDCYTDEQMTTYLVQFERDFGEDVARGLRVIDATEGGVAKRHARTMTFAEAIKQFASSEPVALPGTPGRTESSPRRRDALYRRVRQVRADIWRVAELSRATGKALREILDNHDDQARVNALIGRIEEHAREVQKIHPAYGLVQHLNQTGILNRFKADRAIELDSGLDPLERQRRQGERDLKNVTWLADAADELGSMFDAALASLKSARIVGKPPGGEPAPGTRRAESAAAKIGVNHATRAVRAFIPVDLGRSGLGTPRDLSRPIAGGLNPLQMTLMRLSRSTRLGGVTLLTVEPDRVGTMVRELSGLRSGFEVSVLPIEHNAMTSRAGAIRAGRIWAPSCWRGGIGNLSVFDEVFPPGALNRAFESPEGHGAEGALLVGPDWCFIDPVHVDRLIERFDDPAGPQRLVFSQGAPGLSACIIDRTLAAEFAAQCRANGPFGSIGTILGYLPIAPKADPIAMPACVPVEPAVRDLPLRLIPDREDRFAIVREIAKRLGDRWATASAGEICDAALAVGPQASLPDAVSVQLVSHRYVESASQPLDLEVLRSRLLELRVSELHLPVAFAGGEPLLHARFERAVAIARECGASAVHVRTELLDDSHADALLAIRPDVISIDLHADRAETYRSLRSLDAFDGVRARIDRLLQGRCIPDAGLVDFWIVPRITRRDAVYSEIESFYNRWIMAAGAAVIDPLPGPIAGERIDPLPLPEISRRRMETSMVTILADGTVRGGPRRSEGSA